MKAACEVCGAFLRGAPNRVEIDGAIMLVCGNCAKLGRTVGGAVVREHRPLGSVQMVHRQAPVHPRTVDAPDYELDPDYNTKIRQAREKMGLSQEGLGKMLNEKLSVIRMLESKKLKPDQILTRKLMHYLKINLLVSISEFEGRRTGIGSQ